MTSQEYAGLGILLAGTILVTLEPRKGLPKISFTLPNLMTMAAGFLFASSFVLTKFLLNFGTYLNVFFWRQAGFFLGATFMIYFDPIREEIRELLSSPRKKVSPLILLSPVVYAIANLVRTLALRDAPASLVTGIISSDALFVIVIVASLRRVGLEQFEEKLTEKSVAVKIIAAILFIIGAYIIG